MREGSFFLYVVLSAKTEFSPVDLLVHRPPIHLHTCGHAAIGAGTSYVIASHVPSSFMLPQKGRTLNVWSNMEGADDAAFRSSIVKMTQEQADVPEEAALLPPGLLFVEHKQPFGLHRVVTRDSALYGFGLWTDQHEVLVLTNVENYDTVLQFAQPRDLWIYRMRPTMQANVTVNTARVCSRWARWVRNSAVLSHSSVRFAALEATLFPPVVPLT